MPRPTLWLLALASALACWPRNDLSDNYGGPATGGAAGLSGTGGSLAGTGGTSAGAAGNATTPDDAGSAGQPGTGGNPPLSPPDAGNPDAAADASPDAANDAAP